MFQLSHHILSLIGGQTCQFHGECVRIRIEIVLSAHVKEDINIAFQAAKTILVLHVEVIQFS